MVREAWLSIFVSCWALAACLDLSDTVPSDDADAGGAGAGGSGGTDWPDASTGGGAGAGTGGTGNPLPFSSADFSADHSMDSGANATHLDYPTTIPPSTRFLLACAHWRDNDTASLFAGTMSVAGTAMTPVDPAAVGVSGKYQAGVQCFYRDEPPTGDQTVSFQLQSTGGSYDYVRISTFYFSKPARIDVHATATHPAGTTHAQSITTSEPAVVLAVYTKYYTMVSNTDGFIELFNLGGFGGDATQYAAVLVQTAAGPADWSVTWYGSAWGASTLVAVVPK